MRKRFTLLVLAALAMASGLVGPAPARATPLGGPEDDRIGDWGGDYIIYCKNGFLVIWRLKPPTDHGELVAKIHLAGVATLRPAGGSFHHETSGITVTRFGGRIEVSGWGNGNARFRRNSAEFDSRECFGLDEERKGYREFLLDTAWDYLAEDPFEQWYDLEKNQKEMGDLAKELEDMARDENDAKERAEIAETVGELRARIEYLRHASSS